MKLFEILTNNAEALNLFKQAFPDFSKREIAIQQFSGPMRLDSYWDEGARDYWAILNTKNGKLKIIPENGGFSGKIFRISKLPDGFVVIRHHKGRVEYGEIYLNKENMVNMIPQNTDELPWAERVVLSATRSLKSSYGGISNYRFYGAKRETGITESEWNLAKQNLIKKGMLNSAGAITMSGRNAIGSISLHQIPKKQG